MFKHFIRCQQRQPRCQTPRRLTLCATFSRISFRILLIPDLRVNRSVNLLDASLFCKSRLMDCGHMGQMYQLIPVTFHVSRRLCDELWPALVPDVVVHTSCLFQICDDVQMEDLSGYPLEPSPDIAGKILAKSIRTISNPLSRQDFSK